MNSEFFASVVLLLILLDPLGNVPLILSLLRGLPEQRRVWVLVRENLAAGVMLLLSVFVGEWVLHALRLTSSALEISGGIILFLIAMRMVFPTAGAHDLMDEVAGEPLIVPIAVPMIAGPAALATVLMNARQTEQTVSLVLAIVVAITINLFILLGAGRLARLFGRAGMVAMERLMGLVLTAMAVQMLISGIRTAFFPLAV